MAGNIKGIIVEIGGDTSGLQKALNKVNSVSASLSKELKGINSLLKLDPKNIDLLRQKQSVLNEEINTTQNKLKTLKEIQEKADKTIAEGGEVSQENYRALQREIINTENKLNKLKTQKSILYNLGESAENFGNKLNTVAEKVDNLGNKLTKIGTTGTLALGALSAKSAISFESAFAGVAKTVNATEDELEELRKGILDMSKEIPSSVEEISAVAEAAGQLGIKTENILSFSKAMLNLGNSTNMTAEEAASQLAKLANITQMSQKDFDKLGSAIVDLGNNFATTEADIVDMAMRLAGAGKQVGFSEGEILGLATALSSVGIEAEMGGSAISKAMVKMQNAVELGGNKLNIVLKKTGMTLRDLELMAANDSQNFKEMSQSIGITSTEVKQLITAGTNLEDFAAVSGMTAEEFKRAWKDDAAGALTAFIKGLGDAESKGESAISMLSEMGLTEVRLRDSLLRAAGAGNLFNRAIETGTKAFKENTALTNEANKRYETLDSKIKKTTNNLKKSVISLGDKLSPTIEKILKKADKFADSLNNLNEEETKNIIKTGLMIAAIGPLIKIGASAIKTIGNVTTGIGTLSKAIVLLKNGVGSTTGAAANLANGIKAIISPAGLATIAIAGLAASYVAYEIDLKNATKATREQKEAAEEALEKTREEANAINEVRSSIDSSRNAKISELEYNKSLYKELSNIVDENGKIKEGYENRASVITKQLSEALGIEITTTNNVIDKYKELQKEIDNLILKKKAEAVINANQDKFNQAMEKQSQKAQELIANEKELADAREKLLNLTDKYIEKQEKYNSIGWNHPIQKEKARKEMEKALTDANNLSSTVDALEKQYNILNKEVETYTKDIQDYNYNLELFSEGSENSLEKIVNSVSSTYIKDGQLTQLYYKQKIQEQQKYNNNAKKLLDEAIKNNNEAEAIKNQMTIDSSQKRLETLVEELEGMTSITEENSQEVVDAWKQLAKDSYDVYYDKLSKYPEELRNKIQEMTGVTLEKTPELTLATKKMMNQILVEMDRNDEFRKEAIDNLQAYLNGLNDDELRELLNNSGIANADKVIQGIRAGNLAEEEGKQILRSLNEGISNNTLLNTLFSRVRGVANKLSSLLTVKAKISGDISSLPGHKTGLDYVPYDNYVARLHKGERVLTAEENKELIKMEKATRLNNRAAKINGKIKQHDNSKTIFTTPTITFNVQKMDESNLKACFNYINKKFGSLY